MEYEDRTAIATPEGVELDMALAGVGSRLAARLIDLLIQIVIAFVLLAGLGAAGKSASVSDAVVGVIGLLVIFFVVWAYDVLFETFAAGRTPGKKRLGLRVIGEFGEPETFSMAAVRNLLRIVDEVLTFFLGGLISVLRSDRNQRIGDHAAGTLVVKEGSGESVAGTGPSVGLEALGYLDLARGWDLSGVSAEQFAAARHFLERREAITGEARPRLAQELAARIRPQVPNNAQVPADEGFLELLVAVKSQRG